MKKQTRRYSSLQAAAGTARRRGWRTTEVITHTRGSRVNVVTPRGPRTLRVAARV